MVKLPSQTAAQCVGGWKEIHVKYYLGGKLCALVDLYCLPDCDHKGEIRVMCHICIAKV